MSVRRKTLRPPWARRPLTSKKRITNFHHLLLTLAIRYWNQQTQKLDAILRMAVEVLKPKIMSVQRLMSSKEQFLSVEQVPPDCREVAILSGYRPVVSTPFQCVVSVFNATNETLNFWTHFLPTWYFVWKFNDYAEAHNFWNDSYTWSLLSFMVICCIYPFASCVAHAFSCLSDNARHICYFLDYGALSLYSYGAALLFGAYSLPESFLESGMANLFIAIGLLNSTLSTFMACCSRFVISVPLAQRLRVLSFMLPYVWGILPLVHRFLYCDSSDASISACVSPSLQHHAQHITCSCLGALVYASHFPERFAPGKFDIIGHSHQLLHIFAVICSNEQITAAFLDMTFRRPVLIQRGWHLSHYWSCMSVVFLFVIDAVIIGAFIYYVLKKSCHPKKTDDR